MLRFPRPLKLVPSCWIFILDVNVRAWCVDMSALVITEGIWNVYPILDTIVGNVVQICFPRFLNRTIFDVVWVRMQMVVVVLILTL